MTTTPNQTTAAIYAAMTKAEPDLLFFLGPDRLNALASSLAALQSPTDREGDRLFADHQWPLGTRVTKVKGSAWTGKVVGFYSTDLNRVGYAVESETETGSVQIYPVVALKRIDAHLSRSIVGEGDRLEWQPIETCPRGLPGFLACNGDEYDGIEWLICHNWDDEKHRFLSQNSGNYSRHDWWTHWMPLPEAPAHLSRSIVGE